MFPQGEKRTVFMYDDLPIQITGPGQYSEHPDYSYLEGRKLEDIYPTGYQSTFGTTMRSDPGAPPRREYIFMPGVKKSDRDRAVGK